MPPRDSVEAENLGEKGSSPSPAPIHWAGLTSFSRAQFPPLRN